MKEGILRISLTFPKLVIPSVAFPQDRIIPPDPITPQEKIQTLQRLNEVIQYRLVSNELPKQMRRLKIGWPLFFFFLNLEAKKLQID